MSHMSVEKQKSEFPKIVQRYSQHDFQMSGSKPIGSVCVYGINPNKTGVYWWCPCYHIYIYICMYVCMYVYIYIAYIRILWETKHFPTPGDPENPGPPRLHREPSERRPWLWQPAGRSPRVRRDQRRRGGRRTWRTWNEGTEIEQHGDDHGLS